MTTLALDNKKSWRIPGSGTKISYLRVLLEKFKELSIKLVFFFVDDGNNDEGLRGGAVGYGTVLQTERSRVRFPMR